MFLNFPQTLSIQFLHVLASYLRFVNTYDLPPHMTIPECSWNFYGENALQKSPALETVLKAPGLAEMFPMVVICLLNLIDAE